MVGQKCEIDYGGTWYPATIVLGPDASGNVTVRAKGEGEGKDEGRSKE